MSEEKEVFRLLTAMENTGARLEKEALVIELAALKTGRYAIEQAYDTFITFGVAPVKRDPGFRAETETEFMDSGVKELLSALSSRTLSGNAAKQAVEDMMKTLSNEGAEILFRIMSKDLKCGVGVSTLNKAVEGVVSVFSVMRAHTYEEKRIKSWPQVIEPKLDGFRYTFIARNGGAGFFTRSGKPAPAVDHLIAPMLKLAHKTVAAFPEMSWMFNKDGQPFFVVDGEMIAGEEFNDTSGALRRKSEKAKDARFSIFDMMSWSDFDAAGSVGLPLSARRGFVNRLIEVALKEDLEHVFTKTPIFVVRSHEEITRHYEKFREQKFEGAMIKNPDGLYDKKKSYGWMKLKPEESEDLQIVGYYSGEENTKYQDCLGGIVMMRDGVLVDCGGGFSDQQRYDFWAQLKADEDLIDAAHISTLKGRTIFDLAAIGTAETSLLFNLAEIEYHEVTPAGSLRHPRFVRLRGDKLGEVESK
jgi:DNA ligase 1